MVWMWDTPKGPCLNIGSPAVWQCLWWDVDCGLASRNEWLGAGLEGATHFPLQGYSLSSALPDPPNTMEAPTTDSSVFGRCALCQDGNVIQI